MSSRVPFGSRSLGAAGLALLLTQGFQPAMLSPVWTGQTAGWIEALAASLVAMAFFLPVAAAVTASPGANLTGLAREALGVPGLIATGLLTSSLLVFQSGVVIRQTAEMATSSIYALTPQTFAVSCLVLGAAYGAHRGISGLIRLFRLFLPWLLGATALIAFGTIGWSDLHNLLPVWGPGPAAIASRSVLVSTLYSPLLFMLVAADGLGPGGRLGRSMLFALLGASVGYALILFMLLSVYPYPLAISITFPLHEMSRLIMGGRFFQRIEGFWVLLWVFGTCCYLGILLNAAATVFAQAFEMPGYRNAVPPLVTVALAISLFPTDQGETARLIMKAAPLIFIVVFLLPMVLAVLAVLRRRRR